MTAHSGCSGGCCSSGPTCPCGPGQNPQVDSLPAVAACFQALQAGLHAEQAYYESLPSFDVAIVDAVLVLAEETGLRPGHTCTLKTEQLEQLQQQLVTELESATATLPFRELYARIAEKFTAVTDHPTYAYDTALRIALFTGRMPDAVLVHAGNRPALQALAIPLPADDWLAVAALPAPLNRLTAAEAELCLSICGGKIIDLAAGI